MVSQNAFNLRAKGQSVKSLLFIRMSCYTIFLNQGYFNQECHISLWTWADDMTKVDLYLNYDIILGPKPHFFTSEGNLHGGLGSRSFRMSHVRPHSGLTNLEFGRVLLLLLLGHLAYFMERNRGCEPQVKKLQPTCADRAVNPHLPAI